MSRVVKTTVFFTFVSVICAVFAVSALAELKVGYIRSDYIFSKYEPYREAQQQLEEFQKKEFENLQKMYDDLQMKAQDAQSKELLMTPEMKQQKLEELGKQREEIEKYHLELTDPEKGIMAIKQGELIQPIIDRINEVLMQVAKTENYDFIFDATSGSTILYANEKFDISDTILEEIQKETPIR